MEHAEFYLYLPSNTKHKSKENKTSHYYIALPKTLILKGNWHVALQEIDIPISWYNFSELPVHDRYIGIAREIFKVKNNKNHIMTLNEIYDKQTSVEIFKIPFGNYRSINELAEVINGIFEQRNSWHIEGFNNNQRKTFIEINAQNMRPRLMVGRGDTITLSASLTKFLCLEHVGERENDVVYEFKGPELNSVSAYNEVMNQVRQRVNEYTSNSMPDFNALTTNLYIYTNIVDFSVVGNIYTRLLRTIRVQGNFGDDFKMIYNSPQYHHVSHQEINEIEILIADDQGKPVKFEYGKAMLVLHFKRIS